MVKKKNMLNFAIVLAVVILLVFILYKAVLTEERSLAFSGPNIYRAVYVHGAMSQQGYAVNLRVEGQWVDTGEKFNDTGRVINGDKGRFTILHEGTEITVGGPLSGSEDISANKMWLIPTGKEVVKAGVEPLSYGSIGVLVNEIEEFSYLLVPKNNIREIGIRGDLMLDLDGEVSPTLIQDLENILPNTEIKLFESGTQFSFADTDVAQLKELNNLLDKKNLRVKKLSTSKLLLFIRSVGKINADRNSLLKEAQKSSFNIFSIKIIHKSIQ